MAEGECVICDGDEAADLDLREQVHSSHESQIVVVVVYLYAWRIAWNHADSSQTGKKTERGIREAYDREMRGFRIGTFNLDMKLDVSRDGQQVGEKSSSRGIRISKTLGQKKISTYKRNKDSGVGRME